MATKHHMKKEIKKQIEYSILRPHRLKPIGKGRLLKDRERGVPDLSPREIEEDNVGPRREER
jgi:hypothetical protein